MTHGPHDDHALAALLVQGSVDGLFAVDGDLRYTLWNRAMERFAGKTAEEVLGHRMFDVFPFLRDVGLDLAMDRALAGESVTAEAVPYDLPDGTRRYYDRLYLPLRVNNAAIIGVMGVVRDVTSRRKAEDELRAREEQLRLAVDAAGVGLWSWTTRSDLIHWGDTTCALFGLPAGMAPLTRQEYRAFIHPEDRDRSDERVADGVASGRWEHEYRIVRRDGAVRWVLSKGSMLGDTAVGALIDVTERREREEQLRQAQKLEAVGQLTAGIAHNFNNMLMGMLPNLELVARTAPAELQPLLRDAEQSAQRAAKLVRQLMTYAGRNAPTARRVESIGALVARTVAFCQTTFDHRIVFDTRYDDSALARVDATQFEHALLNALINARDALANTDAPRLTIAVDVVAEGARQLGERPGDYVRVQIGDNGVGMDQATMGRIFEPFFTTKPVGKGTGLGLATTRAIVLEHGGFLACDSAPGLGATLALYFPRESTATVAARPPEPPIAVRGTETVLVVDDEASIRRVVSQMLVSAGFKTRLASSGDEALALLGEPSVARDVRLVILDVSMPGVSGTELRRRIRELTPEVRVLYFSGYALDAPDGTDAVLDKPTTQAELLAKVREVLDR